MIAWIVMKIALMILLTMSLIACRTQPIMTHQSVKHDEQTAKQTLIVFYNGEKKAEVLALFQPLNATVMYDYTTMNGFVIQVNASALQVVKQTLQNHPDIYAVNDDRVLSIW